MRRSGVRSRIAVVAAALSVTLSALTGCSTLSGGGSASPTTSAGGGAAATGSVLAVKIDNVADARPATGLGSAQVIYVEPVEGGLTRIIAVFSGNLPAAIGPVRSARESDLDVLLGYGRPLFAYSGAVPQIVATLHASQLVNASPADVPAAYYRSGPHAAPHNLYLRPATLPSDSATTPAALFPPGPAPSGGTPATDQKVGYTAASFEFRWSGGKWLVSMDGTPFTSTEAGQLGAATVIIQQVATHPEPFPEDSTGAVAPVAQTIGSGTAIVLRDGQSFAATWSRPAASAPTAFTTTSGQSLPVAAGQLWIMLVPA